MVEHKIDWYRFPYVYNIILQPSKTKLVPVGLLNNMFVQLQQHISAGQPSTSLNLDPALSQPDPQFLQERVYFNFKNQKIILSAENQQWFNQIVDSHSVIEQSHRFRRMVWWHHVTNCSRAPWWGEQSELINWPNKRVGCHPCNRKMLVLSLTNLMKKGSFDPNPNQFTFAILSSLGCGTWTTEPNNLMFKRCGIKFWICQDILKPS